MSLWVITGPPCSGKSTWVRERAVKGDIVVDLDRLALAISSEDTPHHEYLAHIRYAAIQIRKTAVIAALKWSKAGNSYIIHAKPSDRARKTYGRYRPIYVELDAPWEVLIERAKKERPPHIWQTMATWWDETEE